MSLDTLFRLEDFGSVQEQQIIKCQRCKHKHPFHYFFQNNKSYKLCKNCREYNRKYLKNISSQELICPRCRHEKEICDFLNGEIRYKLCRNCRDYNKDYQLDK